ncbi:hypothetical protein P872_06170 [Rhodonellum psychrophilum GCM71 = DSM 17998]|uniref:MobA/VirD2-like nuclease domain-containing protein n=2 Tax=Rhodonellum TaxID=336827 RepID=U5C4C9_9BACT|nr:MULTISPECIES: relaxase/mobilization nuclease domain-containing protein [Rhodonellum]ERM83057.1 hypothetical protein P872_06170 [Rhodonellum psychrophilum GCM71 = DSM 17998]SDZ47279.1 Relaxase/Mobilisation nuclease domain-containing protein [Rhodonellum ikkaensis]
MRAKILSSTSTFNGVSYNTAKTQNSKGELMKFRNFGYLQNATNVSPDEMKTFLKAHSNRNHRVKDKQFHAMISCKGREYIKEDLTKIAEEWLHKMGYGQNPYLIVFHSDTKNNHVHIVSSRIGDDGKKVKDNMERIKAQTFINEIMKRDPKMECSQLLEKLRNFSLSTQKQAKLFLELHGFGIREKGPKWELFKYGTQQGELSMEEMEKQVKCYAPNQERIRQLKALFVKYRKIYDSEPVALHEPLKGNRTGKLIGYRSELSDYLRDKFGIEILFHGKENKAPYGYTIIDHSHKLILKGSEVLSLKRISKRETDQKVHAVLVSSFSDKLVYEKINRTKNPVFLFHEFCAEKAYRLRLISALEEYSTVHQGLAAHQLKLIGFGDTLYLQDLKTNLFINLQSILNNREYSRFAPHYAVSKLDAQTTPKSIAEDNPLPESNSKPEQQYLGTAGSFETGMKNPEDWTRETHHTLSLTISDDADDEAVHGRRRRKKGNSVKKHR